MDPATASVITGLVGSAVAVLVCILNNNSQNKKYLAELDKRDELQAYRISQLELKVDKHNSIIERTYELEKRADLQEEKMKVANHRIDDLERRPA